MSIFFAYSIASVQLSSADIEPGVLSVPKRAPKQLAGGKKS